MDCFLDGLQSEIQGVEWVRRNMEGKTPYTLVSEALWAVEEKRNEVEHILKVLLSVEAKLGVLRERKKVF